MFMIIQSFFNFNQKEIFCHFFFPAYFGLVWGHLMTIVYSLFKISSNIKTKETLDAWIIFWSSYGQKSKSKVFEITFKVPEINFPGSLSVIDIQGHTQMYVWLVSFLVQN